MSDAVSLCREHPVSSSERKAVLYVAADFLKDFQVGEIMQLTPGNINTSYLLTHEREQILLQRINAQVFPYPERVAENCLSVSQHILSHLCKNKKDPRQKNFCVPRALQSRLGKAFAVDAQGGIWKAQEYLQGTRSYEKADARWMAIELGRCVGLFHKNIETLDPGKIAVSLPGFHDFPGYLKQYDQIWDYLRQHRSCPMNEQEKILHDMIEKYRSVACSYDLQKREVSCPRLIHGDAKLANVLFTVKGVNDGAKNGQRALAMVDLDTVGQGVLLTDIGDMLRSVSASGGEESDADVECNLDMIESALLGYASAGTLTVQEKHCIYHSLFLITFELGLRFFTDHLQGDRYFSIHFPGQNLLRARVQFQLLDDIREKKQQIQEISCSLE